MKIFNRIIALGTFIGALLMLFKTKFILGVTNETTGELIITSVHKGDPVIIMMPWVFCCILVLAFLIFIFSKMNIVSLHVGSLILSIYIPSTLIQSVQSFPTPNDAYTVSCYLYIVIDAVFIVLALCEIIAICTMLCLKQTEKNKQTCLQLNVNAIIKKLNIAASSEKINFDTYQQNRNKLDDLFDIGRITEKEYEHYINELHNNTY